MDIIIALKHSILLVRTAIFVKYFQASAEQFENQIQEWKRYIIQEFAQKFLFKNEIVPKLPFAFYDVRRSFRCS